MDRLSRCLPPKAREFDEVAAPSPPPPYISRDGFFGVLGRVMPTSDFPTPPPNNGLTVVSLDDDAPGSEPPPYSSPVRVQPPASAEVTQTIVKKRSP